MTAAAIDTRAPLLVLPLPDYGPPTDRPGASVRALRSVPPPAGIMDPPEASADPAEGVARLALVDDFGPRHTPSAELPAPAGWAARMGVVILEAATGARPCPQVMRWCSGEVYDSLVRRSGRAVRRHRAARRPIRIRRVRVSEPDDGTAEVSLVVEDQHRVRALALRLEGIDGRWVVTACEIG